MNNAIILNVKGNQEYFEQVFAAYALTKGKICQGISMEGWEGYNPHWFAGLRMETSILLVKHCESFGTIEYLLTEDKINVCPFPGFIERKMPFLIILLETPIDLEPSCYLHNIHTI